MTATLFQACQEGKLDLVNQLLEDSTLDIDARDDSGMTALQHAVKANNVEIVSQLLAKGADAVDVAQDETVKANPELSDLISRTLQHTQSAVYQAAPVIDSHGGKQMPDGSISYVQPPAFHGQPVDFSMQPHPHHMPQPSFAFQPQPAFFDPTSNPEQRGHAAKDSSAGNLPPPEVARMIPCRFFPNCRYGDKCMFAHPMPISNGSSSNAAPVSPGQPPVFYQSPAYGYPAYGPPQHFYSMAPPMPIQYTHAGVPMAVHMPPPPHMAPAPHNTETAPLGQADMYGSHFASQHQPQFPTSEVPDASATSGTSEQYATSGPVDATQNRTEGDAATSTVDESSDAKAKTKTVVTPEAEKETNTQAASFNSFMAHHAAPFQPGHMTFNGQQMGADGSILAGANPFPRGGKGARRGASSLGNFASRSDFNGKRSTERPACLFFARSACKHGEDCRFPHILPDGTDARGPNAGRSSNHSIEASRAINRALAAKSARGSANGHSLQSSNSSSLANTSSHASNPTNTNSSGSSNALGNNSSGSSANSSEIVPSTSKASAHTAVVSSADSATDAQQASAEVASNVDKSEKPSTPLSRDQPTSQEASSAANTSSSVTDKSESVAANGADKGASSEATERTPAAAAKQNQEDAKPKPSAPASERTPAPIPSKPILNGHNPFSNARSHASSKPQSNGVQKPHQNQSSARSGSHGRANQGPNGRANGAHGAQLPKKVAPQRLPNPDDFPALSNGHGPNVSAAPAAANGAPKVNFSAILSAPAPAKKPAEPKENGVAATDKAHEQEKVADSTDKPDSTSQDASDAAEETKSSSAQKEVAPGSANGTAMPDFASVAKAVAV